MKPFKFQIKNYKSIINSGECYLAELITILAGKNESGKSSILEALYDFNTDVKIDDKAIRIEDETLKPEVSIWFKVSKKEVQEMLDELNLKPNQQLLEEYEFKFTKSHPGLYSIASDFLKLLEVNLDSKQITLIKNQYDLLISGGLEAAFKNIGKPVPAFDENNLSSFKASFTQWNNQVSAQIPNVAQQTNKTSIEKDISDMLNHLALVPSDSKPSPKQQFLNESLKYIPNFIFFDSFTDVFPNVIPIAELATNSWVQDLSEISDLDISIIQGSNDRQKVTHKQKINAEINKDFSKFWSQDLSDLVIEYDNQKLSFWIQENNSYYEPEIRSQGRRWHLAFYIKVSARAKESENNIILIDEPGLYLHANAQRDILKNLEECAKDVPIIFSTHSPYLLEANKLERVRLIQKDSVKGTLIENKIHRVSDSETLTPILTAIGLEINHGIISVDKQNNVVVEGISDYYYLNAFKEILNKPMLNFIFGGSSGNMPKIGTILQGWGCNVIYLYDNDKAFRDALKNIKSEWVTITKDLLFKLRVDGAIEDMFTSKDFAVHVLEVGENEVGIKNSEAVKNSDKVLKSKNFREKVNPSNRPDLEETTLKNFSTLFDELESFFRVN